MQNYNNKKNHQHTLDTIKIQKRVEPKVDESVLKTNRQNKQWANRILPHPITHISRRPPHSISLPLHRGADKSLARPGRKQATKLGIYSTYSQRRSMHFLASCSNFCKP